MLRTAGAAVGNLAEQQTSLEIQRNVLADFCRLVGARLAAGADIQSAPSAPRDLPGASPDSNRLQVRPSPASDQRSGNLDHIIPVSRPLPHLSPRMRQTLRLLLDGDGEKQIAHKLRLSQHTVHVYVRALYRGFGVNSRGELMSHFVAAGGSIDALNDLPALKRATG